MANAFTIPKVLHQIWLGRGETPIQQRRWRRRFAEMNPGWTLHLWTDDHLPFPILNRRAWDASLAIGGVPGCVMRSDILRLELMARAGGVYLDTDIKPVRPLDACWPSGVAAWVACEQGDIISNAAMGFAPNHPAAWRAVNAIEESFFERRAIGEQAGPGFIARMMLEHDDVVLWPPACFHPTVAEVATNPDRIRLLMQAHLFAGSWVEGRRHDYRALWASNLAERTRRLTPPAQPPRAANAS